ncbi:hypothetical protein ACFYM7_34695 [Streptomyces cyaneofuscatus]|uniref:hypothetical protein n=1 Tax=Streptomyces cyaneofuscatus TaxID=66883 RepID=UPI00369CA403
MNSLTAWATCLRRLGRTRLRLALLTAALAATVLTVLTSLPAHAEPSPTPSPTPAAPTAPGTGGQRTPTAEEQALLEEILREQGEQLAKDVQQGLLASAKEELRKVLPDEGGVLGVFNVTDANGLPISVYTVKSDTGDLTEWELGIQNLLTEFTFLGTKWLIAFCCWLIAWSLSFGLAKLLLVPVLAVANSLHTRVILELGLPTLFLAVCALICVCRILFGDRAKGWGDAALSILLAALTTTLLASPPQALLGEESGAIAVTRGLALEVADVILDADPVLTGVDQEQTGAVTSASLARPLTDALTDAFIVRPSMLLQYGRVFDGACARKYAEMRVEQLVFDRKVQSRMDKLKKVTAYADYLSPIGAPVSSWYDTTMDMSTRWAIDHFGDPPAERFEAACVPGDVAAAKRASLDKLGGGIFLLIAALIVALLIVRLAGSFLVAQCRIAWDAVRGEPALIIGTIPGAGRGYLWDWAASVLRSLSQMLTSVISLAVFIIILQAVLDPAQEEWGNELTLRFIVVDLLCIGAFIKRKKLAARSRQTAANVRAKLSSSRIGGTHGSAFAPPASASVKKNHHIGRKIARGAVRTAMVGAALAHGNPLAAAGYAMPRTVGATALMSQISAGSRASRTATRSQARPAGRPGQGITTTPGPSSSQPSHASNVPPHPGSPPQGPTPQVPSPQGQPPQGHPARPGHPPRPANRPARPARTPGAAARPVRPGAPQHHQAAPTGQAPAATPPGSPANSPTPTPGVSTGSTTGRARPARPPQRSTITPTSSPPPAPGGPVPPAPAHTADSVPPTAQPGAHALPGRPNHTPRVSSSRAISNGGRPATASRPAPDTDGADSSTGEIRDLPPLSAPDTPDTAPHQGDT